MFAEPLLLSEANSGAKVVRPKTTEILSEIVVPALVGLIGVGVSVAALTISILSIVRGS